MMLPLDGDDHNERNDCKQTSLACVSSEASLYRCTDSCALFFSSSGVQDFVPH
ncbi:Uncharacterized protein APZ42_019212 [Daphnia magna]|uniref:Uncharacterized protein n=1 Tax=Daphnia magna TaxID=35525 RepID=A0A164YE17_9CRUS|nr:Uncharacterized protein APZ42_019212 [Daphnia magna]